ncbi:rhodanese-like domain-containing protein [Desulfosediminicola ganghwensis]|uniref:rhodanese-like domain-containing protein n=1 Tax=Desulfosediminicola ganghwensis TaxID=2569540 RepID=UPI0010ACE562|nr:rhodanese-like domain-containing protein [Desulfosediminicola ganghwensis]
MVYRGFFQAALGSLAATCLLLPTAGFAQDAKPKVLKPCMQCHKGDSADTIRGKLGSVSMKAETLKVSTGKSTWLVSFDEDTALKGAEAINKIGKDKEVKVKFEEDAGVLYATSVSVKQPAKLAEKDIIRLEALAPLVAKGPEVGNFTIVDARPGKLFVTGHIPGALSIYDAQFEKNIAKLPKNKENLLVFYCGGPT